MRVLGCSGGVGRGPRNAFYDKLNEVLAEAGFDRELEKAVEPYYCTTGRKSLPPGVYFRMLFIGYFEDISSQRGIAWRCEDSRSLARFWVTVRENRRPSRVGSEDCSSKPLTEPDLWAHIRLFKLSVSKQQKLFRGRWSWLEIFPSLTQRYQAFGEPSV